MNLIPIFERRFFYVKLTIKICMLRLSFTAHVIFRHNFLVDLKFELRVSSSAL